MVPTSAKENLIQPNASVISLAEYRRRRHPPTDDDSTPPSPCPFAARPVFERARVETRSSPLWQAQPQLRLRRAN
jgi:hypothetical protein